jgi:hypothetical protein
MTLNDPIKLSSVDINVLNILSTKKKLKKKNYKIHKLGIDG